MHAVIQASDKLLLADSLAPTLERPARNWYFSEELVMYQNNPTDLRPPQNSYNVTGLRHPGRTANALFHDFHAANVTVADLEPLNAVWLYWK
jgi:prepilin-type processing-associated H-X9-DG protein